MCHPLSPALYPATHPPHTWSSTSLRPTLLLRDATTTPHPATHTHRPTTSLVVALVARAGHAGITCDRAHLLLQRCRPTSHLQPMPSPHPAFSLYHMPLAPGSAPTCHQLLPSTCPCCCPFPTVTHPHPRRTRHAQHAHHQGCRCWPWRRTRDRMWWW